MATDASEEAEKSAFKELTAEEMATRQDYGSTGIGLFLDKRIIADILASTDPMLQSLRERVMDASTITEYQRDVYMLAKTLHKDGETEFDENAIISDSDDNGAYVSSWTWVDFSNTPLDKTAEDGEEDGADRQTDA